MNKLQLYITKSFNGYKVLFNINPSEEITRHVHELRRAVDKVHYDATEKNIFYLVTTVDTGTFVTIIRTIPTAPTDHLAAWIYIPNELIVDGEALERVVQVTTRKVSGDKVTQEDVAQLRELFSTEYLIDPGAAAMTASNPRGDLAWRTYNGTSGLSLTELLGRGLFQQAYLDYAGVMFIDGDLGVTVDGADLSGMPIADPAVILPADKTAENFSPYIFGQALNRPTRGSLDANLTVVWKRPGFEDVISEEVITEREFTPTPPETSGSRKMISAASFQIAAQTSDVPLEGCQILVNGIDVTHEPHPFTQAELVSASVVISCEGCAPYTAHIDLAASTRALIRMQERTKAYCFEMPVKSAEIGSPVRFKIYTKKTLTESPLEGYEVLDQIQEGESRTNHLGYSRSSASLVQKAIFAGAGLVVGVLLTLGLSKCGSSAGDVNSVVVNDSNAVTATAPAPALGAIGTQSADTRPTPATAPAATTSATDVAVNSTPASADAIKYLDDNKAWERAKMEAIPALKGLFDDINNFRYDKLTGAWAKKLASSKTFTKLVTHVKQGKKKKRPAANSETFNQPGDNKITVQSFLNRVDP